MRFNVISNLTNGVGLQQDYLLLKAALEARGHTVRGVQFNAKSVRVFPADVNIFLEVVTLPAFRAAPKQWAVPNPEWWFTGWDGYPWDLVLAKTRDCERIFKQKVGARCQYLGWTARDLYQPGLKRERRFLHVAGKSRFKNSPAVQAGCQLAKVPLTMVCAPARISDAELTRIMNTHFCHVMPSAYEGYGQVLHEALGCGQVIITTNAPPMNEIQPAILVPVTGIRAHHAGMLHSVEGTGVAEAVREVQAFSDAMLDSYRKDARAQYEQERWLFYKALDALVGKSCH